MMQGNVQRAALLTVFESQQKSPLLHQNMAVLCSRAPLSRLVLLARIQPVGHIETINGLLFFPLHTNFLLRGCMLEHENFRVWP